MFEYLQNLQSVSYTVDLVDSIPYKTRWGPGVGKVVFKVAFTHPIRRGVECCPVGERPFWQKKIVTWKLRSSPRSSNAFYLLSSQCTQCSSPHCSSEVLENVSIVDSKTKKQRPTCVDKLDDWMELWKKERGGRGRAEHRATELGRYRLEKRAWIKMEN